jgi:hypothetical protein
MPGLVRVCLTILVLFALTTNLPIAGRDATAAVVLHWTSPGDNGTVGTAARYDIRRSTAPITAANFPLADTVAGAPAPALAGSSQTCAVALPTKGVTYYFAIKSVDAAGNWSAISNVTSIANTTAVGEPAITELNFAPPYPNPARGSTRLSFTLPARTDVEIEIFDALGRRVKSLWRGTLDAGMAELSWKLDDEHGDHVPSGVFFARARLGAAVRTRRIVVAS